MRILIAGGGIGGITAALCLAKKGISVDVFEQSSEFGEVGAGLQLSPNCTRVLHYLGLENGLRSLAFIPTRAEVRHWKTGKLLDAMLLDDSRGDLPYYHMHRADLMSVLLEAASQHSLIQLHADSRVETIEELADQIQIMAGSASFSGDALVGADGIHSVVRTALFGEQDTDFTGNVAWRAVLKADSIPAGVVPPVASVWWGPGGHFVHYYVRSGELINCVGVVEKEGWEVESWTRHGDLSELKQEFAGWHQNIQLLIDNIDPDDCFKWALFDRSPMRTWSRDRMTLLGDACHPTLPYMAQGAAMAIEDAAVLAICVEKEDGIDRAFSVYETIRRDRTAMIQNGSRRNSKIFHLKGLSAWFRNRALIFSPVQRIMKGVYEHDVFASVK
ncbi:MAG TPA: FAD-dependent monooxygenase [Pseudomonadales bacterium]|jgi:salicylate hydroxylase|nr:FAD-binding monooxygenase [Gammaproteobacteria bacterium]MDP6025106.1 FAD-dependent monooxygenase [Pseudomonadales bacterium]MDP6315631.1 FAD-dependent monooxygenase [Pseudomonadales bacterium]MDP7313543.1 FAD-dependent monooxygenase [Pseudomonadales bacterium]MDP7576169.1 FAD-dependent monooxygenase [Pseudomonadales bacterium]|tara:strand:+ start:16931 stop:18094 length:1164 start_codon:yes stop_codon:yes gene_type:complete